MKLYTLPDFERELQNYPGGIHRGYEIILGEDRASIVEALALLEGRSGIPITVTREERAPILGLPLGKKRSVTRRAEKRDIVRAGKQILHFDYGGLHFPGRTIDVTIMDGLDIAISISTGLNLSRLGREVREAKRVGTLYELGIGQNRVLYDFALVPGVVLEALMDLDFESIYEEASVIYDMFMESMGSFAQRKMNLRTGQLETLFREVE